MVDGKDVIKGVWEVLDRIKEFSNKVRKGEFLFSTDDMKIIKFKNK